VELSITVFQASTGLKQVHIKNLKKMEIIENVLKDDLV